jgi:hypothetical protein
LKKSDSFFLSALPIIFQLTNGFSIDTDFPVYETKKENRLCRNGCGKPAVRNKSCCSKECYLEWLKKIKKG